MSIFKWDKQASKERKALREEMLLTKEHHKENGNSKQRRNIWIEMMKDEEKGCLKIRLCGEGLLVPAPWRA